MSHSQSRSAARGATIASLAEPPRLARLSPIAARFVQSLRMIALYQQAGRDPVVELTARLGSVGVAARVLALAQTICAVWPENIHVSRACCALLSHDEATIAAMVDAVIARDRPAFDAAIAGLIRADRGQRLHEATCDLVLADLRAC
jgi:hypothetical protein